MPIPLQCPQLHRVWLRCFVMGHLVIDELQEVEFSGSQYFLATRPVEGNVAALDDDFVPVNALFTLGADERDDGDCLIHHLDPQFLIEAVA